MGTMSHSRSPSPHDNTSRKRGRIACRACRQAKVRCNLEHIPCARCEKLKLDCTIDPEYKRTNKRDKVDELENHVQKLQSLIARQQEKLPAEEASSLENDANVTNLIRTARSPPNRQNSVARTDVMTDDTPSSSSSYRMLGNVRVHNDQVEALFAIFLEKYHRFLPILDPKRSASDTYELSTVLFWTIIYIAARHYRQDSDLGSRLMPVLSTHLWTTIGSGHQILSGANGWSIAEIQAMALFATWPMTNMRMWTDRSMVLSSMALASSMHLGLHRPGFELEYVRDPIQFDESMQNERASTWTAVYSLTVALYAEQGHIPLVPITDWMTNNVCSTNPTVLVPKELRHQAIVQKCCNDAYQKIAQLDPNPANIHSNVSFFSLLSVLEAEFEKMQRELAHDMSLMNRSRLSAALLLVQNIYFLAGPLLPQRRAGLLRAYKTATDFLSNLLADDSTNDLLPNCPHAMLRMILRSAYVILRVLHSTYNTNLDYANGKTLYNTAAFFIRQMTVEPKEKDQPIRVAEALKGMWPTFEGNTSFLSQPPTLQIKSRLGASIVYDCLIYYRDVVKLAGVHNSNRQQSATVLREGLSPESSYATTFNPNLQADSESSMFSNLNFDSSSLDMLNEMDLTWMEGLAYPGLLTPT